MLKARSIRGQAGSFALQIFIYPLTGHQGTGQKAPEVLLGIRIRIRIWIWIFYFAHKHSGAKTPEKTKTRSWFLSSTILESQESESSQIVSHTKIHICSSTTIKRFCTSSSPSTIFLTSYQTNVHGSQLATNGSHVNRWRAGWPLMLHSLTYSHSHTRTHRQI